VSAEEVEAEVEVEFKEKKEEGVTGSLSGGA
jgi:hypothetical protein